MAWALGAVSVAEHFLLQLAALLRFQRQGGRGPGQQASYADSFAGFVAIAIVPCIDAGYGLFDFFE
jgi:hypothetical protein